MGKTVFSEKVSASEGENTFKFNGSELKDGMYVYSVGNKVGKFIKSK